MKFIIVLCLLYVPFTYSQSDVEVTFRCLIESDLGSFDHVDDFTKKPMVEVYREENSASAFLLSTGLYSNYYGYEPVAAFEGVDTRVALNFIQDESGLAVFFEGSKYACEY